MRKIALATLMIILIIPWAAAADIENKDEMMLLVVDLIPDTPAEAAGIKPGDVLLDYNGSPTHTLKEVLELQKKVTTDSVMVTILREEERLMFKLPKGQMGVYLKEVLPEIEFKKDAVVIDGIPELNWSTGKFNSFFGALELVANYLNIDKDYLYLYGVSGAAFRLQFHKDWCPSSPDPTVGYKTGDRALEALGLKYRLIHAPENDTIAQKKLREEIIISIDKGIPVIAIDLISIPEWGIITGYQADGKELICRTYFDRRQGYDIADKFPWVACLIEKREDMPTDFENYKASFAIAVENLTTKMYDDYCSGIAAFDKWIRRLEKDNFAKMDFEKFKEPVSIANAWIYERLVGDRELAVNYIELIMPDFPELDAKLKELAGLYKEESELLKPIQEVAIFPDYINSRDDWSAEMRKEEIRRLKRAAEKEKAALKIWKEIVKLTENK